MLNFSPHSKLAKHSIFAGNFWVFVNEMVVVPADGAEMLSHAKEPTDPAALVVDVFRSLPASRKLAARSGVQELLPQRSVFAKTSMPDLADRRDARTGLAG